MKSIFSFILILVLIFAITSCRAKYKAVDTDNTTSPTAAVSGTDTATTAVTGTDAATTAVSGPEATSGATAFEKAILSLSDEQLFENNKWNIGTHKICKYGDYVIYFEYDKTETKSTVYAEKENGQDKNKIFTYEGQINGLYPYDHRTLYFDTVSMSDMASTNFFDVKDFCLDLITGESSEFKSPLEKKDCFYAPVWTNKYMILTEASAAAIMAGSVNIFVKDRNSSGDFTTISINGGMSLYQDKIYYSSKANSVFIYDGKETKEKQLDFSISDYGTIHANLIIGVKAGEKKLLIYNVDTKTKVYSDVEISEDAAYQEIDVCGDNVYCMDYKGIYRVNAKTGKTDLIVKDTLADNFTFIGDWVYFNDITQNYTISDGTIKKTSYAPGSRFCRMKADGTGLEKLYKE